MWYNTIRKFGPANGQIFAILCLLTTLIASGSALKCWECNSKYDARCGDPFSNFSVALVDCDQKTDDVNHLLDGFTADDAGEPKAVLCRKTYQLVNGEVRVVRGCGWVPNSGFVKDRTCFNRAGTHQVQLLHCVCSEDGCNSATSMQISQILALLLLPMFLMIHH